MESPLWSSNGGRRTTVRISSRLYTGNGRTRARVQLGVQPTVEREMRRTCASNMSMVYALIPVKRGLQSWAFVPRPHLIVCGHLTQGCRYIGDTM